MKIAVFSPHWPIGTGPANGIVTVLHHIVPALRRLGHEVYVISPTVPAQNDDPYLVPIQPRALTLADKIQRRLKPFAFRYNHYRDAVLKALSDLHARVSLDIFENEETLGLSAELQQKLGIPVVLRLHGPWFIKDHDGETLEQQKETAWLSKIEGEALRGVQAITCPSVYTLNHTLEHYGVAKTPLVQPIPNPIPAPPEDQVWQSSLAKPKSVLFVGRIDRHKGGDIAIKAFGLMAKQDPDVKFTIVGRDAGFEDYDGTMLHFQQLLEKHVAPEHRDRLSFLGAVDFEKLPPLRREASVTIVPSRWENFPSTVGEAMAYGCPVVASKSFGIQEMVTHQETGLLVEPGDPQDLADKIFTLFNDTEFASRLGQAGRDKCIARYAVDVVAQQTADYYRQVIAELK